MKPEDHLEKINRFEKTLAKLDDEEDHEAIVEIYVLMASHCVNSALHSSDRLRADRDIRHNRLQRFITREKCFGEESGEISDYLEALEKLRPGQAYGRGRNGETARRARELYREIERLCGGSR